MFKIIADINAKELLKTSIRKTEFIKFCEIAFHKTYLTGNCVDKDHELWPIRSELIKLGFFVEMYKKNPLVKPGDSFKLIGNKFKYTVVQIGNDSLVLINMDQQRSFRYSYPVKWRSDTRLSHLINDVSVDDFEPYCEDNEA